MGVLRGYKGYEGNLGGGCEFQEGNIDERIMRQYAYMCCKMH